MRIQNTIGILLFFISIMIISCNKEVLNDEGEKYIDKLESNNKCWEIIVNERYVSNFKTDASATKISVKIRACSGKLSTNSLEKNSEIIQDIADNIIKYCPDIKKYSGIVIECSSNSQDAYIKGFEFTISNNKAVLIESSESEKF